MGKERKIKMCKSCSQELDKSAKICPKCGKDQRNFFKKHKILTGILVLFILGSLGSGAGNETTPTKEVSNNVSAEASNEQSKEEVEDTTFKLGPGSYKVGTDLKEGLYLAISEGGFSYLEVAKDSTGEFDSIISNDNFSTNRYIYLSDGQYLKLQRAQLVKPEENQLDMDNASNLKDGMYKVGLDIDAGEYKVKATGGSGYVEVCKDATGTFNSIVSNDNFEGEKYITVKEGQYLKLSGAELLK